MFDYWAEFPPPHEVLRAVGQYLVGQPLRKRGGAGAPVEAKKVGGYTTAEEMLAIVAASPYANQR